MKRTALIAVIVLIAAGVGGYLFQDRLLALVPAVPQSPPDPALKIDITGVRNDHGAIHVMVFRNAEAFDRDDMKRVYKYAKLSAGPGLVRTTFWDIPEGAYAVMVHHDENGNDLFDAQGMLPLEGYGYSNNVGLQAKPGFAAAAIRHGAASPPLAIHMIYYN